MVQAVIRFVVYGMPGPQGSKRHVGNGQMIESSEKVKPWREAVRWTAIEAMAAYDRHRRQAIGEACHPTAFPIDCPIHVRMIFTLPKPASAPKTRKTWPMRKPDLSKLIRSTEDALTDAGLWADDARVVDCVAGKRFPGEGVDALDRPGVVIEISEPTE